MQDQVISYLVAIAKNKIEIAPTTLHPGNISIGGQFSGLNYIQSVDCEYPESVRSGLVCAMLDGYVGIMILRAILLGEVIPFNRFFGSFQNRILPLSDFAADNLSELVDRGCDIYDREIRRSGLVFPFSFREFGDVGNLVGSLELFVSTLASIYNGSIKSSSELSRLTSKPVYTLHSDLNLWTTNLLFSKGRDPSFDSSIESEIYWEEKATRALCSLWFADDRKPYFPIIPMQDI